MTEETQPTFWAAPELARAGYPVFPLNGKSPAVAGGFYAATTDHSEIAWWISEEDMGDHDIGVATGYASGLVVIEADTQARRAQMEERFGPPTVVTKKGAHWYFRHPRDGKVVSKGVIAGVDCKADGGYVAVPPSTGKTWAGAGIPDKKTLPQLPKRLREELRPGSSAAETNGHENPATVVDEFGRVEAAAVIARHVKGLAQGERHEHLRHLCGALLSRGVAQESSERMLIRAWQLVGGKLAERAPKEVPNTLRTTVAARGAGNATGVPSMERLTPGLFEELETIFSRDDPVLVDVDPSTDGRSYGPLGERILLGKLIAEGIEPPTHLEPDVLIDGSVHWFHGTADTGKTWLAAYLAKHRIEAGENVLIWDKENGPEIYGERLEALGCDPETIDRHLFYHGEPNLRLDDDVLEAYTMRLAEVDPVLVIYDSARGFLTSAGLEENSNDDLDKWYEGILKPVRNRKCAAMVLDHDPKDGNTARGAGRKKDLCDVMWSVKCPYPFDESNVGMVRLVLEKGRRGGLPPSVSFSVGGSENGFVFARSEGTIELEDEFDGLTDSERKVLERLTDFGDAGTTWKEWFNTSGVAKSTFADALRKLVNGGYVHKRNNRYFVTPNLGPEDPHPTGPAFRTSTSGSGTEEVRNPSVPKNTDRNGENAEVRKRYERGTEISSVPGQTGGTGGTVPLRYRTSRTSESAENKLQEKEADKPLSVAEFFAAPPDWLPKQLRKYRENPKRHFEPLCTAVAAEVLGDGLRWEEVAEEVERLALPRPDRG
jgi:Bifunctional DNA primase/polymerase, N-terminal/AAA domain